MKYLIIIFIGSGLLSCTQRIPKQSPLEGMCYGSSKGHLFAENQFCFYPNNAFKYTGHGPSIFISKGTWKYNKLSNEIELTSNASNTATAFKNRVDTMWIDLTGKRIKVKSRKKFLFDKVVYTLK